MDETAIPLDPNTDTSPDLNSAMDNFFSAAPPAPEGGNDNHQDDQAPPPPAGQDAGGGAQGNGRQDQQQQGQEGDDELTDLPDDEDAPIDTTGKKQIRLDVPRFNKIYQGYQLSKEIRDIVPDAQTARTYQQRHNDLLDMKADLRTGNVDRFLNFWKNEAPEGFGSLVERAFEQAPPEVQDQLRTNVLASTIDQAYEAAVESGDPKEVYKAQMLDYHLTGRYRTADALAKPDPLKSREAELTRREQAIAQRDEQTVQQQVQRVDGQVTAAKTASLMGEVDKILAPVKERFKAAPELFDALRDRIATKARQALQNDGEWMRNHDRDLRLAKLELQRAVQSRQRFDVKGRFTPLVEEYSARVRNVITPVAKKLVGEASATLVGENQNTHQRREASQGRRGTSGGGAPSRQSLLPNLPAGADLDSKMDAFFAS